MYHELVQIEDYPFISKFSVEYILYFVLLSPRGEMKLLLLGYKPASLSMMNLKEGMPFKTQFWQRGACDVAERICSG